MRVSISIIEPWDLGEAHGWQPLTGEITRQRSSTDVGCVVIKLEAPIESGGSRWSYLLGTSRHAGDLNAMLHLDGKFQSALTGIPEPQAISENPWDGVGWHGGLAFIGEIITVPRGSGPVDEKMELVEK